VSGKVNGPRPVGEGAPNPFGIFDLGENVHDGARIGSAKIITPNSPERNPSGPATGERRASRRGLLAASHQGHPLRGAIQHSQPEFQYADYGFRVVCDLTTGGSAQG